MNNEKALTHSISEGTVESGRHDLDAKFFSDFTFYAGFFALAFLQAPSWKFPFERIGLVRFSLGNE
jgi:hypothetical protein